MNAESLNSLLEKYPDDLVLKILTKTGLHYEAKDIKVFTDSISFIDKFDNEILITISEISQVEIKNTKEGR